MATPAEPTEPTIRIVDNPGAARYEIYCDDQRAGCVTYRRDADKIVFLHTEIDDRFEGHGLGSRLAAAVLEEARAQHRRVVARCPFIARYIEQHPEYADLTRKAS
jgi:uncharacterized protein